MAHIHELIDWTAGVYIVHKNKVLIRKHEKYGFWIHVGGHVELDEDPVAAAIRECKEEVGLDVTIYDQNPNPPEMLPSERHLPSPAHMNIHYVGGGESDHQHIDLLYYATAGTDSVVPENEDDQWLWMSKEDIEANTEMKPNIKYYALQALETLGT